ncbi:MAG: hypothetical protein SF053_17440 [Bacteroidia bacterium]|nr:hypothetical protein [Bacteroidia bacterium]
MKPSQKMQIPITWQNEPEPPQLPQVPVSVDIALGAFYSAVSSGLNGMMSEGMDQFENLRTGKLNEKQYTYRILHRGTRDAFRNGTRTAVALTVNEGVKRLVARHLGWKTVGRMTRHNALISVIFGVVDQTSATHQYLDGKMDERKYKITTFENVGSTSGAIGGAAAGAMLGSVIPGLGTAAGAMAGMVLSMWGATTGAALARSVGENLFPDQQQASGNTSE